MRKKKTIADYRKEVRWLKKQIKEKDESREELRLRFVLKGADLTRALNKVKDLEGNLERSRNETASVIKDRSKICQDNNEQRSKQGAGIEALKSALCFCISGEPNTVKCP